MFFDCLHFTYLSITIILIDELHVCRNMAIKTVVLFSQKLEFQPFPHLSVSLISKFVFYYTKAIYHFSSFLKESASIWFILPLHILL